MGREIKAKGVNMSNMSYCRFENTLSDLRDCYDNMRDPDDLSKEEKRARKDMIDLCKDIVAEYGREEDGE